MNPENKTLLRSTLEKIEEDIKYSWLKDLDKTREMIRLSEIIHQILELNTMEEYFKENHDDFEYFQQQFTREVLQNILRQTSVHGNNGDQIALNLLLDYIRLWLKFHKDLHYIILWEQIREIFDPNKNYFKSSPQTQYLKINHEKNYDANMFNEQLPKNKTIKNEYHVGDEIDYLVDYSKSRFAFDKMSWVRGKIFKEDNEFFTIATPDEVKISRLKGNSFALPAGTATKDWEWRCGLNIGDAIDCFDRGRWYPATILSVNKSNITGVDRISFRIGFRLYKKYFPGYEKYKKYWPCHNQYITTDMNEEQYIGDRENMDETMSHYCRRIQKFNSMITKENKANQYQYSSYYNSNDELNDDSAFNYLDDLYVYKEEDGKKNYIIGRGSNFSYYYATLLQHFANDGGYDEIINILSNKPHSEEIYMIFYILNKTYSYLHNECISELSDKLTKGAINYIQGIDNNEMRNLKKEVMELISKVLSQFNSSKHSNEQSDILTELTQIITLKMIKTSIFDKKLQGVKSLSDYIKINENDDDKMDNIIQMIINNDIVNEIFGSNSHSQIISRATDIIEILLKKNRLSENDIKLIWTGTQKGDLEGKLTILYILSEVSNYFNPEHIKILLNNIYGHVDSDMISNEIDLTFNLSIASKEDKNIERCLLFFTECLLSIKTKDESKISNLINKIHSIAITYPQYIEVILNKCIANLKEFNHTVLDLKLLAKFLNDSDTLRHIKASMEENDLLILLYTSNCIEYKKRVKEYLKQNSIQCVDGDSIIIDGYNHHNNIQVRLDFFTDLKNNIQLPSSISIVSFLYEFLIEDCITDKDQDQFFNYVKSLSTGNMRNEGIIIELYSLFKDKLCHSSNQCVELSLNAFEMFVYIFLELNTLKLNLKYYNLNSKDTKYIISLMIKDSQKLEGFDILWNIIFESANNDIMNKGIEILHLLFSSDKSNPDYLLSKCIELLKSEAKSDKSYKIKKCLKILQILIEESEKEGTGRIKSHFALRKRNKMQIDIVMDYIHHANETYTIKVLSNTTIHELKEIMGYKLKRDIQSMKVSYKSKEINLQGKTLYELGICNKDEIKITGSSNTTKADLIEDNGDLNPLFRAILNDWFDKHSENDQMLKENLAAFTSSVLTNKERITPEDNRIANLFRNYDKEQKGYLSRNDFIRFYTDSARTKPNTVWDNLTTMKIRKDLRKFDDEFELPQVPKAKLPRFKLGNDDEFIQVLFSLVNKRDIGKEVSDFLFMITTNQEIYNLLLRNPKDNIINGNDLQLIYTYHIIKSFIEDIEIDWKDINSFKYQGFDKEDPIDAIGGNSNYNESQLKLNWVKEFIEHNFSNLIANFSDILNRDLNDELSKLLFESLLEIVSFFFASSLRKYQFYKDIMYESELQLLKESERKLKESEKQDNNGYLIFKDDSDNDDNNNNIHQNHQQTIITLPYEMANETLSLELQSSHLGESIISILINYPEIMEQLINSLYKIFNNDYKDEGGIVTFEQIITNCFKLLLGIFVFSTNQSAFISIINRKEKQLLSIITKGIISSTNNIQKSLCWTLTQYTKMGEKIPNWNFLLVLFKDYMTIFDDLQKKETNNKEMQSKNLTFFFDFFSFLFEIIFKMPSGELRKKLSENNIDLDKFILTITKIVHDDLSNTQNPSLSLLIDQRQSSSNSNNKTPPSLKLTNYLLLGYLKIIAKAVNNSPQIKEQIVSQYNMSTLLLNTILFSQSGSGNSSNQISEEDAFISIDSAILADTSRSKNKQIREISYELILALIKNNIDCIDVFLSITKLSEKEEEEDEKKNMQKTFTIQHNYSSSSRRSKKEGHVGLKNLGCICYMNSILQQMFMVPTFRYVILQSNDGQIIRNEKNDKDDNVLHQLQRMYAFLTLSSREDFNPKQFCNSFKDFDNQPINTVVQQDSQEFLNAFCDKIENSLKDTAFKYIINDVFVGRTCSQVICEACETVSNRFEDFYNLTVEVANMNTLKDSLNNLIEPEIIDGFNCETCQKKVRIKKRTSISDLPNVLIIHLKRFFMNYETEHTEKINTKLEFPNELNLKPFSIEELMHIQNPTYETDEIYYKKDEYYEYNLVGVNIHLGSADGGHYFSLINTVRSGNNSIADFDPKNQANTHSWLKFNDSSIKKFNIKQMNEECFGGSNIDNSHFHCFDNTQSAYLLVYERKYKTPIRVIANEPNDKMHGIISFKDEDKAKTIKEYNISNKKITNDASQLVYNSMFYDCKKNEYYKYIPFFSISKKAPAKYYQEVTEDNIHFEKQQTSEDSEFKQFYNSAFNQLESSLNLNISEYDKQIKLKLCQIFIFYIFKVAKKKANDFNSANMMTTKTTTDNSSMSIINIVSKLNALIDQSLECLVYCNEYLSKDNNLNEILLSDNISQTIQVVNLIQKMLKLSYNNKDPHESFWSLISKVLSVFNQLSRDLSSANYPIFDLLDYILDLNEIIVKKCFTENYFTELINFLKMNINYSQNTFYQNRPQNDLECNTKLVNIIYKLFKRSSEFNLNCNIDDKKKTCKDMQCYLLNEQLKVFESNSLLKFIYANYLEFFIEIMIVLQSGNRHYSISTSIELSNFINEIFSSRDENEMNKLMDTLIRLLSINDEYQIDRMTILIGHPVMVFKESEDPNYKWPVFGYKLLKDTKTKYIKYITNNHAIANSCILGKIMKMLHNERNRIDMLIKLIENAVKNNGMFKYLALMPSETVEYPNFIIQAKAEIDDYINTQLNQSEINDDENKFRLRVKTLYEQIDIMMHSLTNSNSSSNSRGDKDENKDEDKEKEEEDEDKKDSSDEFYDEITPLYLIKVFQGFINDYVPKDVIKEEITHVCSGSHQHLLRFEYFTTYVKLPLEQKDKESNDMIQSSELSTTKASETQSESSNYTEKNIEESDDDDNNKDIHQFLGHEGVLTIPYSERKISEKAFIERLLKHFNRVKKVIVKSNQPEINQPVISSLIRYLIYNENYHEVKATINIKNSSNRQHNQMNSNDFVSETINENIKGKNYSNILLIHKFKHEKNYYDSMGINFDANIN